MLAPSKEELYILLVVVGIRIALSRALNKEVQSLQTLPQDEITKIIETVEEEVAKKHE